MTRSKKRKIAGRGPTPIDYGDLSREELIRRAQIALRVGWDVRFKFTCGGCGERCAFADLNTLWTKGECSTCGHSTTVVRGGFMIQANTPTEFMLAWIAIPGLTRFSELLFPSAPE
jgi:hypothetical protein